LVFHEVVLTDVFPEAFLNVAEPLLDEADPFADISFTIASRTFTTASRAFTTASASIAEAKSGAVAQTLAGAAYTRRNVAQTFASPPQCIPVRPAAHIAQSPDDVPPAFLYQAEPAVDVAPALTPASAPDVLKPLAAYGDSPADVLYALADIPPAVPPAFIVSPAAAETASAAPASVLSSSFAQHIFTPVFFI